MSAETDQIAEKLIGCGYVPNTYVLDLNRGLSVPHDMNLPHPWNLPSRLFQFPIEVNDSGDGTRRIGLMHPLLARHPFVQKVEAALGFELARDGAPNAYGVSKRRTGLWWHAVDLISAGLWRKLLETQQFTTRADIAGAVAFGLDFSRHDAERAAGYISTTEARQIMRAIDSAEPNDRRAFLWRFSDPMPCKQESGAVRWPVNWRGEGDAEARAWGRIIGIESGWFAHDRAGFLQWTEAGRDRYAAGETDTFTESATGQEAFAF